MHLSPTVAICIPTYNQRAYLARSISSAFAQDYDAIEVWVSDDASTDGTSDELAQIAKQFPQMHHFQQPTNLGISRNNNFLLRRPTAEFVVRLDSDDILEPNYVRTLLPLMMAHRTAGYGHAAVQLIDREDRSIGTARVARPTGFRESDDSLLETAGAYRVAANIVMFRSEALRRLDYYRHIDFVEDYDLAVRMADAGYGNVYCDSVLARYRVWNDVSGVRAKRKAIQLRGYTRIFEESLQPAFTRRGWSLDPLWEKRRSLALRHAPACFAPQYDLGERQELSQLIVELAGGENPRLRSRLVALSLGLRPAFEMQRKLDGQLRSTIKSGLSKLRSASFRK